MALDAYKKDVVEYKMLKALDLELNGCSIYLSATDDKLAIETVLIVRHLHLVEVQSGGTEAAVQESTHSVLSVNGGHSNGNWAIC